MKCFFFFLNGARIASWSISFPCMQNIQVQIPLSRHFALEKHYLLSHIETGGRHLMSPMTWTLCRIDIHVRDNLMLWREVEKKQPQRRFEVNAIKLKIEFRTQQQHILILIIFLKHILSYF